MSARKSVVNPLLLVVAKQKVGQEDTDKIALPLLAWFDAAKRGQCSADGCNHITMHLLIAMVIAARTKSKTFHNACTAAYEALRKAAARPTKLLNLTTTEYQEIRKALGWYLRSLPMCEIHTLNVACKEADKIMRA